MRKITLTFGLTAGAFLSVFLTVTLAMWNSGTLGFENGETIGYTGMLIAMSMVFFGIKSFRDNHMDGVIDFRKGFKVGILIALIASSMYVATWEVFAWVQPEEVTVFMNNYTEYMLDKAKEAGATQADLDQQRSDMAEFQEMYKNPLVRVGVTFVEVLPVGLLVTLISAAILRRKETLPAQPAAVG